MTETTADPVNATAQPTQYEKLRAVPWSLAYDLANTFFVQLTFFGSVFILFLDELGLNESQIGVLLSIMPFLSLLSLFITPPVAKAGYKKTFLTGIAVRNIFTAGLLLVPLLATRFPPERVVAYVALITVAFAISRAVAMTAFFPWQQEYIPQQMRGRYAGYSSILVSLAGLAAAAIAGYLINRPFADWRFPLLFGIGVLFGLFSVYLASHFPGGAPSANKISLFRFDTKVFSPLRDSRFVRYLMALGLTTLAIGPIFSFLPIFMKERVGLNEGNIIFLQTGGLIGSLLSSYFWGWLADRYGSKPVALTGLIMVICLPVLWFLMPRASPLSLPLALAISLFQGISSTGWGIGAGRLLFVGIVSSENRTEYLSQYNAWTGVLSGAGSILAGSLLQTLSSLETTILNFRIDSYSVLFGLGFLLSLTAALILSSLRTVQEAGLGQFAGLFIHGNPLLAISSVIRFYYAREEADVVTATQRLGMTRSPLTVEELIDSLNDPRFYVRFEAMVSITRHSADDRLVEALIEVMEGPDPALSVIAAWALGRIGSARAIPALQNAFHHSKYRSVKAHAARALGTLGDTDSIPSLIKHVQADQDLGLRVACASSLGKLRVREATPALLHILYIDSYPQSRREMGLSLARLLDAESRYIELTRKLDEDPGTSLAQEMDSLRSMLSKRYVEDTTIVSTIIEARDQFALGNLESGFARLADTLEALLPEQTELYCEQILHECGLRLRESGRDRLEYPILAVIALAGCAQ
ncbi:MAG TPA: MFS transporter [Anaerolineales bacterium]|nr:MFS transporter [Anaerolineales bacterium]